MILLSHSQSTKSWKIEKGWKVDIKIHLGGDLWSWEVDGTGWTLKIKAASSSETWHLSSKFHGVTFQETVIIVNLFRLFYISHCCFTLGNCEYPWYAIFCALLFTPSVWCLNILLESVKLKHGHYFCAKLRELSWVCVCSCLRVTKWNWMLQLHSDREYHVVAWCPRATGLPVLFS